MQASFLKTLDVILLNSRFQIETKPTSFQISASKVNELICAISLVVRQRHRHCLEN